MTYAKIENGQIAEYPIYEGDLRLRFSNVSFPTPFVAPEGYVAVVDITPPQVGVFQNLAEGELVEIDGEWSRQWVVTDATPEQLAERTEQQWSNIRAQRNHRLTACDWTQLPDAPLTDTKAANWGSYRQALRDITNQSDPFNIEWPVPPLAGE
jgi:hypothetical protein